MQDTAKIPIDDEFVQRTRDDWESVTSKEPPPQKIHRPVVLIQRLASGDGLPLPAYQTAGASGLDLSASLLNPVGQPLPFAPNKRFTLQAGLNITIGCGFAFSIPPGFEGQVRSRSGHAAAFQVSIEHGVGTVDCDYRGEVKLILANRGALPFEIVHGMRLAQLIIAPVARAQLVEVASLDETARGDNGLGSTGDQP